MQQITKTRDGCLVFNVDVAVPAEQAEIFANALTGNDDDILLAAETAMRRVMSGGDYDEEVELTIPEEDRVKKRLVEHGQAHHHV